MTKISLNRRHAMASMAAIGIAGLVPGFALAQVTMDMATIVVGLSVGGATDAAARNIAEGMRGTYARSVLVENRTGAGARLAIQHVADAKPDGSTLVLTPASMMAIYPYTYIDLAYDPKRDLVPVGIVATTEVVFAIGPAVPDSIKTIADYLEWVKTATSAETFAHGATGSGPHFLGELLGQLSGIKMVPVGYRGSQPAVLDMLGGHVPAVAAPLGEFLPHIAGGKVRVLGVTGTKRSRFLPDTPTFEEAGIALSDMTEWFGVFAPAKTSAEQVRRASSSLKVALQKPGLETAFGVMGMEVAWSTPESLRARLDADLKRWADVVQRVGFTAQS